MIEVLQGASICIAHHAPLTERILYHAPELKLFILEHAQAVSLHLFAAAADVFPLEPLPPDSALRKLPNFILTPHVAGGTRRAAEKAAAIVAAELRLFLEGKPLRYCANPEVLLHTPETGPR